MTSVQKSFDKHSGNSVKAGLSLPSAIKHFSISPFNSRSTALAMSTLLYFEYLSNTVEEEVVEQC